MLKILQTDSENQNMKTKISKLIFLLLFVLCNIFILKAQDNDEPPPPPKIATNKKIETVETAKYYFVFQIDADSKVTLSVQNNEYTSEFGTLTDANALTNFFSILKDSGGKSATKKQKVDSFIIVRAEEKLNYGALTDFLRRTRDLSSNQIKIYSSTNAFESFIQIRKKPTPKDRPNPLTLIAEIKADRKVKLNVEEVGNLDDLSKLQNALVQIFKDREKFGAFREGTNEVEKTVSIKAPSTVQFSEIIILIKALQKTGAQPIELQIDDLQ